ncbi:hypothetical protein ACU686_25910 [Yinghuangia aomiensis]
MVIVVVVDHVDDNALRELRERQTHHVLPRRAGRLAPGRPAPRQRRGMRRRGHHPPHRRHPGTASPT